MVKGGVGGVNTKTGLALEGYAHLSVIAGLTRNPVPF